MHEDSVNLREIAASAAGRTGVVWALQGSSELNANLVCFGVGGGVGDHVNDEVDVIVVGVSGSGSVKVDGRELPVSEGTMIFIPRGARRSTRATIGDFAYLSIHLRRGPLQIGS